MSGQPSINIAVDALPYHQRLHRISDYSGEQIFSKQALPLFREQNGTIEYLAASAYHESGDGQRITIGIREDLFWHTGEKIVAADFVRGMTMLCRDAGNRFQTLLCDIEGFSQYAQHMADHIGIRAAGEHTIVIRLKYRNVYFQNLLCLIATSPLHHADPSLTAGPYYLSAQSGPRISLQRNPFYRLDQSGNTFDAIHFLHMPDDRDAASFHHGQADVSCDTGLDFQYCLANRQHRQLKQAHAGLIALLSPGKIFAHLPAQAKKILSNVIDREQICRTIADVPKPAYSYLDNYGFERQTIPLQTVAPLPTPLSLSIAYEDFYPNTEIIQALQAQLRPYNIVLTTAVDPYGRWESVTHLRFEIRKSIASTPLLLYRADISRGLLAPEDFVIAQKYFSCLLGACDETDRTTAYRQLDAILLRSAVAIPLLTLPQWYFSREDIVCDTLFTIGRFTQHTPHH